MIYRAFSALSAIQCEKFLPSPLADKCTHQSNLATPESGWSAGAHY